MTLGMSLPTTGFGTTDCAAGESEGGAGFGALNLWQSGAAGCWVAEAASCSNDGAMMAKPIIFGVRNHRVGKSHFTTIDRFYLRPLQICDSTCIYRLYMIYIHTYVMHVIDNL